MFLPKFVQLVNRNKLLALLGLACLLDAAFVISGLAIQSAIFVHPPSCVSEAKASLTHWAVAHVVGWTIGPPCWFFLETFTLDEHLLPSPQHATDADLKAKYDRLKIAQELAAKVWAAVLVAILFLVSK